MDKQSYALTDNDLKILLFLVKRRLKYESRRQSTSRPGGRDIQFLKVWELSELSDKLEALRLAC